MADWEKYHKKTKEKPPRPFMIEAVSYVKEKKAALDLGAGAMTDSEWLAKKFNKVVAVDIETTAEENTNNKKIEVLISSFKEIELADNSYDYINAQYSLPFIDRDRFEETMEKIFKSLREGGVICGQFFGDRDEWNKGGKKMTFLTKEEVIQTLSSLEIIKLEEQELDKKPVEGDTKHWHLFSFIAHKKVPGKKEV